MEIGLQEVGVTRTFRSQSHLVFHELDAVQEMSPNIGSVERIPTEVLCDLFLFFKVSWPPSRANRLGWIPQVAHVCKRWRDVSLGFPFLWADIVCAFSSPDATDTILERALHLPLQLRACRIHLATSALTPYQLSLATKYILNIHTLIHPEPHDWSNALSGKTLSCLRVLEIARWKLATRSSPCAVDAPMLQKLTLHNFLFPFNAPALRYLKLSFKFNKRSRRIPPSDLLCFLNRTPLLEELFLDHAIKTDISVQGADACKTVLSHLRELHYTGGGNAPVFWREIHAPPELAVYIKLDEVDSYTHLSGVFEIMTQRLCAQHYDCLSISCAYSYDSDVEMNLWRSVQLREMYERQQDAINPAGFNFKALIAWYLEGIEWSVGAVDMLEALPPNVDLASIRYLDIAMPRDLDYATPLETERLYLALMPFTAVQTVVIDIEVGQIHILGEDVNNRTGEHTNLFPTLRHLVIQGLPGLDDFGYGRSQKAWRALNSALTYRRDQGLPIETLTLNEEWPGEVNDSIGSPEYILQREEEKRSFARVDAEGLEHAAGLVGNIVDRRKWNEDKDNAFQRLTNRSSDIHPTPYSIMRRMLRQGTLDHFR